MSGLSLSKKIVRMLWILIVVPSFLSAPTLARAPNPQNPYAGPGRYEIENVASGKVLELSSRDARAVQQWPRAHRKSQQWVIEDAGNGYVSIKSAVNGLALDVEGGRAKDGARVIVSSPTAGDSQLWKIEHGGEGLVRFTSRLGKALDLPHGSRNDGVQYETWDTASQDNQRFRLAWISAPEPVSPGGPGPAGALLDEKGSYELGYSLGVEDAKAHLRRIYARHKGKYASQWEEAFIEGYYDGYDSGRPDTTSMRPAEKENYDEGYRAGKQDYLEGRKPNYMRHARRFDLRSEPYFRRGYEDGYYSAR